MSCLRNVARPHAGGEQLENAPPLLLRNANHHLARLREGGKGGLAFTFEREIAEILDPFSDELPRNLRIEEQGRFAVGYYHQRFAKRPSQDSTSEATDTPEDEE